MNFLHFIEHFGISVLIGFVAGVVCTRLFYAKAIAYFKEKV